MIETTSAKLDPAAVDWGRLAAEYSRGVDAGALQELAGSLGVSIDSLQRLKIGWDGTAWTFPERDATGLVIGISRRLPSGKKLTVTGSRRGLTFEPTEYGSIDPYAEIVLVVEGASDVAAGLDLGFCTVGRPGAFLGIEMLRELLKVRSVVVVGENDGGAGHDGAEKVASELLQHAKGVRIIFPPSGLKDLRAWANDGLTREKLDRAIAPAEHVQEPFNLCCTHDGGSGVVVLCASFHGEHYTDRLNITRARDRERFCKVVCAKWPGLDATDIEQQLEQLAVAEAAQDNRGHEGEEFRANIFEAPAWVTGDGRLAEQMHDPALGRTGFVVATPDGNLTVTDHVEDGDRTVLPVGRGKADAFVTTGAIRLPSPRVAELPIPETRELLEAVQSHIGRYVGLRPTDLVLVSYYILLTYVADKADAVPYLVFRSDFGTGKTRALSVIGGLCCRPATLSASPTPAVLFRVIDAYQPTLLVDEFDRRTEVGEDIVAILNAGYLRGATVLRCGGDDYDPRPFRCYGPKLIATRRDFNDPALESRLLVIRMPGDMPSGLPVVVNRDQVNEEAAKLRDLLTRWRFGRWHQLDLTQTEVNLMGLEPRAIQLATPILALAEPGDREQLRQWFIRHCQRGIEDQADGPAAKVARIVVEHFTDPAAEPLPLDTLRERLRGETDEQDPALPTVQKLGYIAKDLGLPKGKQPANRRTTINRDDDCLRRLRRRYVGPGTLPETLSTLSPLRDRQSPSVSGSSASACDDKGYGDSVPETEGPKDSKEFSESPSADSPTGQCFACACGGRRWWRSKLTGGLVCAACHPPASPELVGEWVEGGRKTCKG